MRVLVTGFKGFIGGYVTWKLRVLGYEILGLDRKYGSDIAHVDLPKNIDVVVHCAANLFDNFEENLQSTRRLVHAYPQSKFILTSSAAVYGNTVSAVEEDELSPFGVYGHTKVYEELAVEKLDRYAIFRLANVYGYGTDHGYIQKCAYTIPKVSFPDHIRDYVHVSDVSSTLCRAVQEGVFQGIYNLGTEQGTRNIDVFRKFHPGVIPDIVDGDEEIAVSILCSQKAQNLGFRPRKFL